MSKKKLDFNRAQTDIVVLRTEKIGTVAEERDRGTRGILYQD